MRLPPLLALQGVYAMNALALALWLARIPDVRTTLALDYTSLSFALLGLPAGIMSGFLVAPGAVRRSGYRMACILSGVIFPLLMILPALATGAVTLFLALLMGGFAAAFTEVAMNALANAIQIERGRRIMSRCHGFWSFGAMAGGLLAGASMAQGISFLTQQLVLETLIAIAAALFAVALPHRPPPAETGQTARTRLHPALILVCILPLGGLMVEGTFIDWSALFVRDVLAGSSFEGALAFATFSIAMGIGRLSGDLVTERLGLRPVLIGSGVVIVAGILLFALSGVFALALLGTVLAGLGASNVYPLAMTLSGALPGGSPEGNVAVVALFSFSVFLLGPPLIGFLADAFGLGRAFLILLPFALISPILAGARLVAAEPEPAT